MKPKKNNVRKFARKQTTYDSKGHFEEYANYSKSLRYWFLVFGIGAIVLLVTNKDLFSHMKHSATIGLVVCLFLGVILQILLTLLNKYVQWNLYEHTLDHDPDEDKAVEDTLACKIANMIWIDLIIDCLTILFFSVAVIWFLFSFFPIPNYV